MKRYLRFGEIPKNGKSVNFLKMTNDENEDFTYCINSGEFERAFEIVPECAFEKGVSVFEIDNNEMPALSNLQLISSLLLRADKMAYIVTGEEVGRGNDGEPIIVIEKVEHEKRFSKSDLVSYSISAMRSNFAKSEYDAKEDYGSDKIFYFYKEYKVNRKTGEKVDRWTTTKGKDWALMPGIKEYVLNGWTFTDPVNGFDTKLGIKGE